jgi:putative acetyltransferase
LRVRPYASVDLDSLILLFQRSVRVVARRDYTVEQVFAWAPDAIDRECWTVRLAASDTWVAAFGERPAGFISLEPEGHLDMLYVDPDFQSRGVASRLLHRLEASAEARGLARLLTEASITARPFFERRGFRMVEAQTVTRRGQQLTNYRMERHLAEVEGAQPGIVISVNTL